MNITLSQGSAADGELPEDLAGGELIERDGRRLVFAQAGSQRQLTTELLGTRVMLISSDADRPLLVEMALSLDEASPAPATLEG